MKLLICVSGIYFFYLYYGLFQEGIYVRDETDGSRFKYTYLLLSIQCTTNAVIAFVGVQLFGMMTSQADKKNGKTKSIWEPATSAPTYLKRALGKNMSGNVWMGVIAFTYVFAMGCSNMALQFVNYPTQALGKSCKMIPIMVFNVFVNSTKYTKLEYGAAALITVGIVVFRVYGASKKASGDNSTIGLVLLFASLCLDGLTSSNQKTYRKEFSEPTFYGALKMMLHTNLWAIVHVTLFAFAKNEIFDGVEYLASHPNLYGPILKFSLCSAFGQLFIFLTITGPGPLACTMMTTTRKFFTILLSVMMRPENSLTGAQWGGVLLVFGGLGMKLAQERQHKSKKIA